MRLVDETKAAVRELQEPTKRVVTIGANEAAVPALLQIIVAFRRRRTDVETDVPRTPAPYIAEEVLAGTLHFGVLTTHRIPAGLSSVVIAADDLQVLLPLSHALASHERVTMEQFHRKTIIAQRPVPRARLRTACLC